MVTRWLAPISEPEVVDTIEVVVQPLNQGKGPTNISINTPTVSSSKQQNTTTDAALGEPVQVSGSEEVIVEPATDVLLDSPAVVDELEIVDTTVIMAPLETGTMDIPIDTLTAVDTIANFDLSGMTTVIAGKKYPFLCDEQSDCIGNKKN